MVHHDYGSAIAEVEAEGHRCHIAFRAWVETAMGTWRLRGAPNWLCSPRNFGPTSLWSRPIVLNVAFAIAAMTMRFPCSR